MAVQVNGREVVIRVLSPFAGQTENERASAFGPSSAPARRNRPFSGAVARVTRAGDPRTEGSAEEWRVPEPV